MESETPLTAAELREKRRQRILGNSENRMNRILSGPNGDEKRAAPAMEGGEAFSFAAAVPAESIEKKTIPANPVHPQGQETFSIALYLKAKKHLLSLTFGLIFKILTLYFESFNAIIPFAIFFFTLEYLTHIEAPNEVSAEHMKLLLSILPPSRQQYAKHMPFLISTIPRFMQDTVTMIGGFLLLHIPMFVISL